MSASVIESQSLPGRARSIGLLILGFTVLRLILAAVAPLLPQEAYYWTWSRYPDWSYFDHPPLATYSIALTTALLGPIVLLYLLTTPRLRFWLAKPQPYLFDQRAYWVLSAIAGVLVGAVWNYAVTAVYTWKKPNSGVVFVPAPGRSRWRCEVVRASSREQEIQIMNRTILITSLTVLLLAGCAAYPDYQLVAFGTDMNYLTFDHPFTEKSNAEVHASAERLCARRKQVAIRTSRTCSLTKCTTNYQFVEGADVTKYGL